MTRDRSDGYQAYVEMIARGIVGNAPEVHPQQLKIALDRFSDLTIEHGIDLRQVMAKFWRVKTWEKVCERIGVTPGELKKSLALGTPPQSVLAVYGLASFYHSCIKEDSSLPVGLSKHFPLWTFMNPYKVDETIRKRAHQLGVPMKIVYFLIKGNWVAVKRGGALGIVQSLLPELDHRQRKRVLDARRRTVAVKVYTRINRRRRLLEKAAVLE
ncbi:hypothetical protein [Acidovorax sp. Root217]|uniref:hypothetical protein n=1 Tax=Acidovorax sp. Root217 TaxID=1736492 RepID=UPI0012F90083|nr:hypothetical protein [Acidovorax sp. Root217]